MHNASAFKTTPLAGNIQLFTTLWMHTKAVKLKLNFH